MKMIVRLMMLACLMVVVAAPSYAETGEAWQLFECEILDETSEDQVVVLAEKWVDTAKSMKGGEGIEVHVFFPVSAEMGENDFMLLLKVPSFAAWGALWDAYDESPAADVEDTWSQMFDCPDSGLFEGFEITGIEPEP